MKKKKTLNFKTYLNKYVKMTSKLFRTRRLPYAKHPDLHANYDFIASGVITDEKDNKICKRKYFLHYI